MQGAALGPLARVPSIPLFYCMPDDSGNAPSQNQLGQLHPCDAEEYPADRSNPPVEHRREASRICCIESHHRLRPRAMNPQTIRQRIVCRTPASFCCGHVPHRPAPPQTAWNPLFRVRSIKIRSSVILSHEILHHRARPLLLAVPLRFASCRHLPVSQILPSAAIPRKAPSISAYRMQPARPGTTATERGGTSIISDQLQSECLYSGLYLLDD